MKKTIGLVGIVSLSLLFLGGCSPNQAQLNQPTPPQNNGETAPVAPPATSESSTSNSTTTTDSSTPTTPRTPDTNSSASVHSGASANVSPDDISVSLTDAINTFNSQYPNTDITEIKLKAHRGIYLYEMEGMDDSTEYKLHVSALDGSVSAQRQETLDRDEQGGVERRQNALNLDNLKSMDEINQIALGEIADGSSAYEWKLEREMNTTYWEVHVGTSGRHAEVKIDAQSGQILEVDYD